MQDDAHSDRSDPARETAAASKAQDTKQKRAKTSRPLPTVRVSFEKQIRCLRSYGLLSHDGTASVQIEDVAKAVDLNSSTVSLCNPFFVDMGFLIKSGRGAFTPSTEILEMVRAYDWGSETAPHKLAPLLRQSWAGLCLGPRLRLGPIDADEAITMLADSVRAGPAHKAELNTVLDYLRVTGVILRDGNQISWPPPSASAAATEGLPEESDEELNPSEPAPSNEISQRTSPPAPGLGGVSFTVSIQVDAQEISRWSPERITAFFSGLAQVLAAQREGGAES